jgi:hypothetical protein
MAKLPPLEERDGSAARADASDAADWVTVPSRDGHPYQVPPEIAHLAPAGAPWTELEALLRAALLERERGEQAERTRQRQLEQAGKRAQREQAERERMERRLRRLEQQARDPAPARGYGADDRAIARMARAENKESSATDWNLAGQIAERLPGRGTWETKRVRARKALALEPKR